MFDLIVKNFGTDVVRSLAVGLATYLVSVGALPTGGEDKFVAGALYFFTVLWAWWENVGDKRLHDFLASKGQNVAAIRNGTVGATTNAALRSLIFVVIVTGTLCATLYNARASDVLTKTAPLASQPLCTPQQCIGWMAGFGLAGNGTNADIVGNGLSGSVFAGGGMPFVDFGANYWDGKYLLAFEVGGGYQFNVAGAVNVAGSVNGVNTNEHGWDFYQEIQVGGNLSGLFGGTPLQTPAPIMAALMAPYAAFGADERPWGAGWRTGAGAKFVLGPNMLLDVGYRYINYGSANIGTPIKGINIQNDNLVFAKFNFVFAK